MHLRPDVAFRRLLRGKHALQVARMIMMGIEFTGKAPFSTVFLHGLVGHPASSKSLCMRVLLYAPRRTSKFKDFPGTGRLRLSMLR